ncbi:MAG: rhomboid family intramembrane serine protease [Muribaculaceae bacterium]|nr:rhomboid family intramembrane serine protease [Muribaculaceae bacterium]MDE6523811.1 rhomboid family intramembrane serine protease [Muribaculaceae bacterium]
MRIIEKWTAYCGGSTVLAWLTLGEAAIWLLVTLLTLIGQIIHFYVPIAEWLTLPSLFTLFITRPWTLLTYMAIHFDVLHVLFNILWLYWFGRIMLITLSDRHLLFAFIGGGLAGGILFLASAAIGYGSGWLCGCSAAVIAVMSVAAIRLPDHPVNLFLIGEVRLKWVAVVCCLLTFLGGGGNQAAHIGGLIWGIAFGLMLRNGTDPTKIIPEFNKRHQNKTDRKPDLMVRVLKQRQTDMDRLDTLLDKIKLSGYESLSRKERKELNDLSKKLSK